MTTYAAAVRSGLVEALRTAGPDAPTLCAGWTSHDLAAHLVAREHRPDSGPGILLKPLAGWTERVRTAYARRPYDELVALVAAGPPLWSPFRLPGVDEQANFVENLVHTEDVRRGVPGWQPRELPAGLQDKIWTTLSRGARLFYRNCPVALTLARPDGTEHVVSSAGDPVRMTGEPLELLLYTYGRRSGAVVELTGSDTGVARLQRMRLGI